MLDDILHHKREELNRREREVPLAELQAMAGDARPPRDFVGALRAPGISLIAEIKRRSPSKGVLREPFDPLAIARAYAENGARAISVLADEHFFGGGPEVVRSVAYAPDIDIPVMFKEFVLSPYQVYLARAVGADAILLIVRMLEQAQLGQILNLTHELGMQALVEVFLPAEAERALAAGARIVGINNRDLQTFRVDLQQSEEIRRLLPANIITVSESGLSSRADVVRAEQNGFDGMLVGEALMTAPDIGARVRELLGMPAAVERR